MKSKESIEILIVGTFMFTFFGIVILSMGIDSIRRKQDLILKRLNELNNPKNNTK